MSTPAPASTTAPATTTPAPGEIVRQPRTWIERLIATVLLTPGLAPRPLDKFSVSLWNTIIRWDDTIHTILLAAYRRICTVFDFIGILTVLRFLSQVFRRYVDWVASLAWRRALKYAFTNFIVVWKRTFEYVDHFYRVRLYRVLRFWIAAMVMITIPLVLAASAKEGKNYTTLHLGC